MIYVAKDKSLNSLLRQEALKARGLYTGNLDNWWGPRSEDAYAAFLDQAKGLVPAVAAAPVQRNKFRDINAKTIDLIQHFEGCYLEAYQDSVGVWTIGFGHTGLKHRDGSVHAGRNITQEEADALFRYDMDFFEGRVQRAITVPLNDDEFGALVSFDFNTGGINDSTLRRKLNAGNRAGAANEFLRWNKAGGRVLAGLTRRRRNERRLFLSETIPAGYPRRV